MHLDYHPTLPVSLTQPLSVYSDYPNGGERLSILGFPVDHLYRSPPSLLSSCPRELPWSFARARVPDDLDLASFSITCFLSQPQFGGAEIVPHACHGMTRLTLHSPRRLALEATAQHEAASVRRLRFASFAFCGECGVSASYCELI